MCGDLVQHHCTMCATTTDLSAEYPRHKEVVEGVHANQNEGGGFGVAAEGCDWVSISKQWMLAG